MASIQSGRRPALIPGSASLSPEEARAVLQGRVGLSSIPPPDLRSTEPRLKDEHRLEAFHSCNGSLPSPSHRHHKDSNESQHSGPMTSLSRKHERVKTLASRDQIWKTSVWERNPHKNPFQLRLDNKRKRMTYSENDRRRYSVEVSEDIPHMSEVTSDDGIRSVTKDLFGERGLHSLFDNV